jgi:hypothetical protein
MIIRPACLPVPWAHTQVRAVPKACHFFERESVLFDANGVSKATRFILRHHVGLPPPVAQTTRIKSLRAACSVSIIFRIHTVVILTREVSIGLNKLDVRTRQRIRTQLTKVHTAESAL